MNIKPPDLTSGPERAELTPERVIAAFAQEGYHHATVTPNNKGGQEVVFINYGETNARQFDVDRQKSPNTYFYADSPKVKQALARDLEKGVDFSQVRPGVNAVDKSDPGAVRQDFLLQE